MNGNQDVFDCRCSDDGRERITEKQTLKETVQQLRINKLMKDNFSTFKTLNILATIKTAIILNHPPTHKGRFLWQVEFGRNP